MRFKACTAQKGLSQGFKFLHGLLNNINKKQGKKNHLTPTPWPPGGAIFRFFQVFLENFRRRSVRVLKLHRGFILTKKGDINPQTNLETPPGPLGRGQQSSRTCEPSSQKILDILRLLQKIFSKIRALYNVDQEGLLVGLPTQFTTPIAKTSQFHSIYGQK